MDSVTSQESQGRQALRPSILHVEDDHDLISVVAAILADEADVSAATTLKEAEELLKTRPFDLVILDISLPDGSGLSLLPQLGKENFNIPVVIFSVDEMGRKLDDRVAAALVKSITSNEELLETVRGCLRSGGNKS